MSISKLLKAASISCLTLISCSFSSITQAVTPNAIELTYFASQVQCGQGSPLINVQVDLYRNEQFVQTLSLNDTIYLTVSSFEELSFQYNFIDAGCHPKTPTEIILGPEDTVPDLKAAYDQDSIQEMLNDLNEYEELFLVELGSTNPNSAAYDLQDVVMIINNNPNVTYSD